MTPEPIRIAERHWMKSNNRTKTRFLIVVSVVGAGMVFFWVWWRDGISAPDPSDTRPATFSVVAGEGVRSIAANLATNRLIRSPTSFFILVKLLGIERNLQAGDYRLSRSMDAKSIATELTHGLSDVWVTTLEGWRVEEIATKLAKELEIPETEFLKYAREGYMFPDTYLIPRDATAAAIARLFLDTFDKRLTPEMLEGVKRQGLTRVEFVTLASIVEREGKSDEDRPIIAGILLKRWRAGWPLQADATIQYALGYQAGERSWWKKVLGEDDKDIASPFNTYRTTGLPPGPIANPGLSSFRAVISPKETSYWYYLHDPKGAVHYAATIAEHTQNIATYLR